MYSFQYSSLKKSYPEDIQCVIDPVPGLGAIFISNKEASQNLHTLEKYAIRAVLTAAKGLVLSHSKSIISMYKYVPAEDHEHFDLSVYFDESADFIDKARRQGNVLVHCMAGVSRSVSLVIAYLIRELQMSFYQAFAKVKARRSIISPNEGFIQQLKRYENKHYKTKSLSMRPQTTTNRFGDRTYKPWDPYTSRLQSPLDVQNIKRKWLSYDLNKFDSRPLQTAPQNHYSLTPTSGNLHGSRIIDYKGLNSLYQSRLNFGSTQSFQGSSGSSTEQLNQRIEQLRRKYLGQSYQRNRTYSNSREYKMRF